MSAVATRIPLRFSHLKHMAESPAHYRHALTASYDSPALRFGRIVDVALLGGGPLCVFDGTRRGKAWDNFRDLHADEEIYTASEVECAEPVIAALRSDSRIMAMLESGHRKDRFSWEWLGRECSGEPDVAGAALFDLKTTRCAAPHRFMRDARFYGYPAQLAWYRNGVRLAGRGDPHECYLIAIEKKAPYPIVLYRVTEAALEAGLRQCRLWMEQLKSCEESNSWPGYCESVVDLDVDGDVDLTFGEEEETE